MRAWWHRFMYWLDWGPNPATLTKRHGKLERITKRNKGRR